MFLVKAKEVDAANASNEDAFNEVVKYFEDNETKQITVPDLVDKMKELTEEDAYSTVYMKKKLLEHFGDSINFIRIGC